MGILAVEGMEFHAHHGIYESEKLYGLSYLVDVYIETDVSAAADEDALEKTIDYEVVYNVCKEEMAIPGNLVETVVSRIISNVQSKFENILSIKVRVSKLNPPLSGKATRFYVEKEESFREECPVTGEIFACYKNEHCWCQNVTISDEERQKLKESYNKCVGPKTLKSLSD